MSRPDPNAPSYDLRGKVETATDPLNHTTTYEYDLLGRLTKIIHPATDTGITDFIIHRYCSGIFGITDENDLFTEYVHDHINQLKKIIHALAGYETEFGYDPSGNLTSLIDPKEQETDFQYYDNDWLQSTTYPEYPEGVTESYDYWPVGTLKTLRDTNGALISYGYDDVHRLTSISANAPDPAPDLDIGYTYDDDLSKIIMTDDTGTTDYAFDALNRLKKVTYHPSERTIDYGYDEVGNLKTLTTPFGTVTYEYYDNNLLHYIYLPNGQKVTYYYYETNNLKRIEYPNGTYTVFGYDTRNRLTAMTNYGQNDAVISTYEYTLDGVGNRTQTDLNEPLMPSYNPETTNYVYNTGNILASADGTTYAHDDNGNRTTKTNGTNVTSYTYDSLNRLTQTSTTGRTIQYIYNGLGHRVGKIDNGMRTNYLIDPRGPLPQVLAEMDASNNLISFYVYDGAGLVAKVTPQNQYYFYHYDGLGSTIAITDSTGEVKNKYAYPPEGLVGVQETIPNPFQYVGRYGVMAEGNGLYYMRARYYDPEVGRFVNKDPIGYRGGINLYAYVQNNPINWIDPSGLTCYYSQTTGQMICINDQTGQQYYNETGYSGTGEGRNNPAMQDVPNVGPIPRGPWLVGTPYNSPNTGPNTIPLAPLPDNECFGTQRDCSSFRGHGNNAENDASTGCIVLPPNRTIPPGEIIFVVP